MINKYIPNNKKELQNLIDNLNIKLSDIYTANITDMSFLFFKSKRKDFSDIEKWDVSKVIDMFFMFKGAISFNQDLSNFII